MFFYLSKALAFVLTPSNFLLLMALAGLFFMAIKRLRMGYSLLVASILLLVAAGWSPLGPTLLMTLEDRFPRQEPPPAVTGIIMLGGAVDIHITGARGSAAWNDQAERITTTAELARRYPSARIILSGGAGHPDAMNESSIARDALVAMGVGASRLELETRSRNTCENASESARLASAKPGEIWLLITSANHMPRAIACFQAANFAVLPFLVDYHTRGSEDLTRVQDAAVDGLAATDLAAHEWLGLLSYRIAGLTRDVFPEPMH